MTYPVSVFLHGWLMCPRIWDAATRSLPANAQSLGLWQPCHGHEACLPAGATMESWSRRTWERIDQNFNEPVVLVGHSMGALLAIQAALDHPAGVAGLVLTGATSRAWSAETVAGWRAMAGAAMQGWSFATASQLAPWLFRPSIAQDSEFVRRWADEVARYDLAGMEGLVNAIATRPPTDTRLPDIAVPVLLVHGAQDASVPLAEAEFIARSIPRAELVVIADAGHCPPLETPEVFADHVRSFVSMIGHPA